MTLQQNPLDFSELMGRCMGERDFACGILENFLDTCDRQINDISELARNGSCEEVAKLAHRFKGTAATVAARPLTQALEEIEKLARDQAKSQNGQAEILDSRIGQARQEILRLRDYYSTLTT